MQSPTTQRLARDFFSWMIILYRLFLLNADLLYRRTQFYITAWRPDLTLLAPAVSSSSPLWALRAWRSGRTPVPLVPSLLPRTHTTDVGWTVTQVLIMMAAMSLRRDSVLQPAVCGVPKVNSVPRDLLSQTHSVPSLITRDILQRQAHKVPATPRWIMPSESKLPHNLIRHKWAFYHYLVLYHWLELTVCLRTVGLNSLKLGIFLGTPDFESCVQASLLWTLVHVRPSHPDFCSGNLRVVAVPLLYGGAGTSSLEPLPSGNCLPPSNSRSQGPQTLFWRRRLRAYCPLCRTSEVATVHHNLS